MNENYVEFIKKIQFKDPERKDLNEFESFLINNTDVENKENLKGHLCSSVFIVDFKKKQALLIFHPKLKKWMQPGGHLDGGETIVDAAIRELYEETGIFPTDIKTMIPEPFDAGVHEFNVQGKPFHYHYDFRFLADVDNKVKLQPEYGIELKWFDFKDVPKVDKDGTLTKMIEYTLFHYYLQYALISSLLDSNHSYYDRNNGYHYSGYNRTPARHVKNYASNAQTATPRVGLKNNVSFPAGRSSVRNAGSASRGRGK
jgi:8-oxo-dGTP pyrophosphatase MutT (NUDIX family)